MDFGTGGVAALQHLARLPRRPAGPAEQLAVQEEEARIRDDFAVYGYAYDNQDLDAVVDFFADDCVIAAPRGPMRGLADVREHYRAAFAAGTTRHIWSNVIVRVVDPAAEAYVGAYHHTLLLRDEHTCVTGTDIRQLRRVDGAWKIAGRWLTIDTGYPLPSSPASDDRTGQDDHATVEPLEHVCACDREGGQPCFAAELRAGRDIDRFCRELAL